MEDVSCLANKAMCLISNYNNNTWALYVLFSNLTILGSKIQSCKWFPSTYMSISSSTCAGSRCVCLCSHTDLQLFHSLAHPPPSWRGLRWRWRWGFDPSTPERSERRANASFRCQETLRVSTNSSVFQCIGSCLDVELFEMTWLNSVLLNSDGCEHK